MDMHGPGIPGPCMFLECGVFAITLTFAASKQSSRTNTSLTNDAKMPTRSQEIEDNRIAVTNMDHK
jgi:hypothetical protein